MLAKIYNLNITMWNDPAIAAINPGVSLPAQTICDGPPSGLRGNHVRAQRLPVSVEPYWASTVGKGISISFPKAPPTETADEGKLPNDQHGLFRRSTRSDTRTSRTC